MANYKQSIAKTLHWEGGYFGEEKRIEESGGLYTLIGQDGKLLTASNL